MIYQVRYKGEDAHDCLCAKGNHVDIRVQRVQKAIIVELTLEFIEKKLGCWFGTLMS